MPVKTHIPFLLRLLGLALLLVCLMLCYTTCNKVEGNVEWLEWESSGK